MKALVKKSVIAASIASAMLFAGAASAATANPFDFINPTTGVKYTADSMTGSYKEVITFNADKTFNVALLFQATAFNSGGSALYGGDTGLSSTYGLYATYNVSGVYSTANNSTTFKFTPGSGDIAVYLDNNSSIYRTGGFTAPTSGAGAYKITGQNLDTLLATGVATDPSDGTLAVGATCGSNGINCGSFGSTTTLDLTKAGSGFFVSPSPFYNLSFQSGVLTSFSTQGTQTIDGTLNVVFQKGAEVPEPASLGLLGLGLLGLGVARRRKQKQA
jgi:hypothetical protein